MIPSYVHPQHLAPTTYQQQQMLLAAARHARLVSVWFLRKLHKYVQHSNVSLSIKFFHEILFVLMYSHLYGFKLIMS